MGSIGDVRQTCVVADWSPLRALLADVDTSVTLAWDELDGLVGGLPRSAYVHNAFWKGDRSGWPGFRTTAVKVGESVTFVRGRAMPVAERQAAPTPMARSADPVPDLVLVGCVKKKLDVPAPARELYTSPLFRKERAYAEQAGVPWFVLSAEHGLVAPDEVLAPYDLRLSKTSRDYRRAWGARVVERLGEVVGPISGKTVEVHAGSAYTDSIRDLLIREGATVVEPLAGLPMGARLAWYGRPAAETPVCGGPICHARLKRDRVADHADRGERGDHAGGVPRERRRRPAIPRPLQLVGGCAGRRHLSRGLGQLVRPGLIYAGLAGATRSRSGRKSKNTLWGRIKTMHLGGRHEFSTFRLSLGSVLAEALGEDEIDEEALTAWMHEHLRLVAVPVADADTLGDVETDVLAELNPPLNLDKVKRDALRAQLSAMRKKHGRRGRSSAAAAG